MKKQKNIKLIIKEYDHILKPLFMFLSLLFIAYILWPIVAPSIYTTTEFCMKYDSDYNVCLSAEQETTSMNLPFDIHSGEKGNALKLSLLLNNTYRLQYNNHIEVTNLELTDGKIKYNLEFDRIISTINLIHDYYPELEVVTNKKIITSNNMIGHSFTKYKDLMSFHIYTYEFSKVLLIYICSSLFTYIIWRLLFNDIKWKASTFKNYKQLLKIFITCLSVFIISVLILSLPLFVNIYNPTLLLGVMPVYALISMLLYADYKART